MKKTATTKKKEEIKGGVQIMALSMETDIPDYEHKAQGKNIKLFGPENSYYAMVNKCYDVSPTNACIVKNISDQIYGKGLYDMKGQKSNKSAIDTLFPSEEVRKIAHDYAKLGASAIQVAYTGTGDSRKVSKIAHIPTDTIGIGMKNNKGEIKTYYYCADWSRSTYLKITSIPAFGTSNANLELLYINSYDSGMHYFTKVDYHAGLKYAKAEGEMADFILNKISRGFSPTLLLNFNNGVPSPQEQQLIKNKIQKQYEGADGDNFILSFQEHADQASTIKGVEQPDAFQQYHWVSTEATEKIVRAHRIVSEILVGVKNNMGLGNNSEEMKSSFQLHNATVIRPKQDKLIEGFEKLLEVNGLDWELYFRTLMPSAFVGNVDDENEEIRKETGIDSNRSPAEESESTELSSAEWNMDDFDKMLLSYSEPEPEGYDLERVEFNMDEVSDIEKLAATANSTQDTPLWKVRYAYTKGTSKTPLGETRRFCKSMLRLADQGRVYRKEDIAKMSADGINGEFAHTGGKYDIFLYGGGVNCYHRWERRIYKKKRVNGKPAGGNAMQNTFPVSVSEARRQGFRPEVNNPDVAIAEIDKPNKGSLKY